MLVADDPGGAGRLDLGHERSVHRRDRAEGLHHRPGDQVGEADLATGGAGELVVDHDSVDLEKLGRDGVNAGGARHGEAGAHVLDDAGRRPRRGTAHRRSAGEPPRRRAAGRGAQQPAGAGERAAAGTARQIRGLASSDGNFGWCLGSLRGPDSRRRTPASSHSPTPDQRDTTRTSPRRARRSSRRRPRARHRSIGLTIEHDATGGDRWLHCETPRRPGGERPGTSVLSVMFTARPSVVRPELQAGGASS